VSRPIDLVLLLALRASGDPATPIGPWWLQESARDITALGGFTVLALVTVTAVASLAIKGRRAQAAIFCGAVVVAQALSEILKAWVGRPRPPLRLHLDLDYGASFPSGHAMMSAVVYLTLASVMTAGERRRQVRMPTVAMAMVLIASIGVSRVYLGVHWPSDVLAGWLLGSAVALAASLMLAAARREPPGVRPGFAARLHDRAGRGGRTPAPPPTSP